MRGERATRPCAACGTPLTRLLSQARGAYWYCDKRCQDARQPSRLKSGPRAIAAPVVKETRPCANCGTPITDYPSARTRTGAWTCSRQCAGVVRVARLKQEGRWTRPPRRPPTGDQFPCTQCGKPFSRRPREVAAGRQFCSRECWYRSDAFHKSNTKRRSKTGRHDNGNGYTRIRLPEGGWAYEHRVVAEKMIGRPLKRGEQVHHLNGQRSDNRPENLEVISTVDHVRLTMKEAATRRRQERSELAAYRERFGPLP